MTEYTPESRVPFYDAPCAIWIPRRYADEAEGRAAVVAEAMSWLRTPWHHNSRVKGAGVDCANFVLACYVNAGLIEDQSVGEYPADWHIHRDLERFVGVMTSRGFGAPIQETELQPGDAIVFKIGRVFSHGAIYIGAKRVVHAYITEGQVCIGELDRDETLRDAPKLFFSYWAARRGR